MILEATDICKSFGGIQALENVKISLRKGEVHALLGENGAGKSTLLNILAGALKPDFGIIRMNGQEVHIKTPQYAKKLGIVKVHQELQLISEMSVAQNVFLGYEPVKAGWIVDSTSMERKTQELLHVLEADFSPLTPVKLLSTAQMQMVEIAKALLQDFSILALDEPTSSLTDKEIGNLFKTIKKLKESGKTIIYISHRIDEVFEISDIATVFRDGKYIDTVNLMNQTKDSLVRMMVGRDLDVMPNKLRMIDENIVLLINDLSDGKKLKNISFDLHKGEILGISGLVGAGRTEMARLIFGADPKTKGSITICGKPVHIHNPKQAIQNGIMLIPEDRKIQGLVGQLSVSSNIILGSINNYEKLGIIDFKAVKKAVSKLIHMLDIAPQDDEILTRNLSGGNQQKVVLAKALNMDPLILILDEPTRGIDVNAKQEIYKLIFELSSKGISIIMISSELPEILLLSDRILIMYEGKITGEISRKEATEEAIMSYAMGGTANYEYV